jgi:ABC-2 type transport system ATP-binding protein
VQDVIASSHLTTSTVSGHDGDELAKLAEELTAKLGSGMVAPFGLSLHVSGRDAKELEAVIAPYRGRRDLVWTQTKPSLEDVFIDLMSQARDNFQQ